MNKPRKLTSTLLALAIGAGCLSWADTGLVRKVAAGDSLGEIVREIGNALRGRSTPSPARTPTTGAAGCAAQLPNGRAPTLANATWQQELTLLCYREYGVAFSGKTRTPLWSAEHLTRDRVEAARQQIRDSKFFEDTHIPAAARSRLADYARSGWDRGHMSPSGDMSTPEAQAESFSLANMVPQDPNNNRHLWASIESGVRNYAMRSGSAYVITGPLFKGAQIAFLNDRVAVPTHLWKLVYDPAQQAAGVYYVENKTPAETRWLSVTEFEQLSGHRFGLGNVALLTMPRQGSSTY